jgi:hypothetical protein
VLGEAGWNEGRKPDDQHEEESDAKYPEPAPRPLIAGHLPASVVSMARIVHACNFHGNLRPICGASDLINNQPSKLDSRQGLKPIFPWCLNVAAEQAAEKMSCFVILSEAKNLSSI